MGHDVKDIQPGDIIVTSPAPIPSGAGFVPRTLDRTFGGLTKAFQGSFTHALMATGKNHAIDIRPEIGGVRKRPLHEALGDTDYVVLRPSASAATRRLAAKVMKTHIGKPYSYARAGLTGAHMVLPSTYGTAISAALPHKIEADRGVQCADAVASSYASAGHKLLPSSSLASPAHLLAHPDLQVVSSRVRSGKIRTPLVSPGLSHLIREKMSRHVKVADEPRYPKVRPGDILLVSPGSQPWANPRMPFAQRVALSASEKVYRSLGPKTLGHFKHAGIVGTNGKVIEALDAVRESPLHKAIGDKDFLILRPNTSSHVRRQAAIHASKELGKPYSVGAMLASGANTLLPTKAHVSLSRALVGPKATRKSWMCGGLVAHAYDRAGHDMSSFPAAPLVTPGHLAAMPKAKVVGAGLRNTPKASTASLGVLARTPALKERYQEAGLKVAAVPGLSRERRRALGAAHAHLSQARPDWDEFLQSAKKKSFVNAIQADPRSNDKLRRHVDQMSRLQTGRVIGQVAGTKGTYDIVRLRGGGLGCTCNDWRFKKSVASPGQQECKHIREFKAMKTTKMASAFYVGIREGAEKRAYGTQLGGAILGGFAGSKLRSKNRYDEGLADYSSLVHGLMTKEEYDERQHKRRVRGLRDTAIGTAAGALGGQAVKSFIAPRLGQAYSTAKKEIVDLAGEAGRKAVESAHEPAKDIARAVAKEVVNEGETRIKENLGQLNVRNLAHEAGEGIRHGIVPSWFRRAGKSRVAAEPNPIFSAY